MLILCCLQGGFLFSWLVKTMSVGWSVHHFGVECDFLGWMGCRTFLKMNDNNL